MGKLNIFEISFSNISGVFYAGNILQGHVTVELNEPMKMRGITLRFEGKAYVHWTEQHSTGSGKNRRTVTRHYSASEVYFNQDSLLFGIFSNQGSNTTELAPGRHVFPFQFLIPQGLPSSFEGLFGHVRYTVKCIIDKPWKFDHSTKRPFTIISILDLNQQPNCLQGVQGSNQKTLCCWCCKSGPIQATFHIDRTGYVPGEAIRLFAEINNGSNRKMDKSYVDLKMITMYHATTKSRMQTREVARVTRPAIEAYGQDQWNGEQLVIPPLPPSFLAGCRIIDVRYVLQLNVDPSGPSFDLEVPLEILIGTIPLMSVVQQFRPMSPLPPPGYSPSAPPAEGAFPDAPPTGIPNMPPPSYSECITGRVNIREAGDNEHTGGNLDYAPVYTYYNWGNTPGALPVQSGKQ
ncbi:unnamed protein product [Candidula unifasciata]|uniref:Arrestin C-terminal-like domain-containing protein n=1 Tax=Candidula unifasciata TaxID=100452 RepID=A0A8S3ZZZ4_9EUPU|nr:unnamed protein product [Candidula unifasciata]